MKLRLRHFFGMTAVAAVWAWAILHWEFQSPRWAAATFTLLTVFGSSWMTGAALFASLASLIEFQTCACGHLSTWNALPVTGASCLLGWWGVRDTSTGGIARPLVSICVAILATSVLLKNLEDLFIDGHAPIWPDLYRCENANSLGKQRRRDARDADGVRHPAHLLRVVRATLAANEDNSAACHAAIPDRSLSSVHAAPLVRDRDLFASNGPFAIRRYPLVPPCAHLCPLEPLACPAC